MTSPGSVQCIRRIRSPIDQLIMQPLDKHLVNCRIRTTDVSIVTWSFPIANLQQCVHKRYEAEAFHLLHQPSDASSDEGTRLGFATLLVGNNIPEKQSRLEKWLDPAPHPTLSLRISVIDRVHWQRSQWLAGSICKSLCWGRLPSAVFSIPLDWKKEVKIETEFDRGDNVFKKYKVSVPDHGFELTLADTGRTLFDRQTRIVEGFLDNESALRQLGLAREVNMSGLGNSVYRQTLWSSPSMPNVASVVDLKCGTLFESILKCKEPIGGEPVAAWLVDSVDETLIYQMEGHVEDENDPNDASTFGERSLVERVQRKAMNRYEDFRDDVRRKTYSDIDGTEQPR